MSVSEDVMCGEVSPDRCMFATFLAAPHGVSCDFGAGDRGSNHVPAQRTIIVLCWVERSACNHMQCVGSGAMDWLLALLVFWPKSLARTGVVLVVVTRCHLRVVETLWRTSFDAPITRCNHCLWMTDDLRWIACPPAAPTHRGC